MLVLRLWTRILLFTRHQGTLPGISAVLDVLQRRFKRLGIGPIFWYLWGVGRLEPRFARDEVLAVHLLVLSGMAPVTNFGAVFPGVALTVASRADWWQRAFLAFVVFSQAVVIIASHFEV